MNELHLPYPDDLPAASGQSADEFENEMRFLMAAKLYELGRITSGRAANLAGMDRVAFLDQLGAYRIPVWNYSAEELDREIEAARRRGGDAP